MSRPGCGGRTPYGYTCGLPATFRVACQGEPSTETCGKHLAKVVRSYGPRPTIVLPSEQADALIRARARSATREEP